jgi:hypothetical protein
MILTHKRDNHLYLVFQDFEDKIEDIYKSLEDFPSKSKKSIKGILDKNFFSNVLDRQKSYINSITTYIDDISDKNKQYYFHLYILPKDINITYDHNDTKDNLINKVEALSIKLFKLYSNLNINKKGIELFENYDGNNFLQLEASFYIQKLESIYGNMINYKANHKNKIICSDRVVGIEIDELNIMENNPLKNYQFIKTTNQQDLIRFIYSTMLFLKENKLQIFKDTANYEYEKLLKLINKINNLLLKISSKKNMIQDKITKDSIEKYLRIYKNKKELKQNKKLYKIIKSIFYTQLDTNIQFFASIDLTKVFELIIEKRLNHYYENLFIGEEENKRIVSFRNRKADKYLNSINYLLSKPKPKIYQYPDFLIKDNHTDKDIYHIVDAKYKLENNIYNSSDIRQLLIYSILFNKEFTSTVFNQKYIKKMIIYAEKSDIDIDHIDGLQLQLDSIDLFIQNTNNIVCNDSLFDSEIVFMPIEVFNNNL